MPEVIAVRDRRRVLDRAAPASKALTPEVWSRKFGVPLLVERHSSWTGRTLAKFQRGAKRLMFSAIHTFGKDKAKEGLQEPVPANVLPLIATKRN